MIVTCLSTFSIYLQTEVVMSNLVLSMDDKYVPRAKEFLPERWLRSTEGELSYKNMHKFVVLPFGVGPRSCIGKRLAKLELETAIAKVIFDKAFHIYFLSSRISHFRYPFPSL